MPKHPVSSHNPSTVNSASKLMRRVAGALRRNPQSLVSNLQRRATSPRLRAQRREVFQSKARRAGAQIRRSV